MRVNVSHVFLMRVNVSHVFLMPVNVSRVFLMCVNVSHVFLMRLNVSKCCKLVHTFLLCMYTAYRFCQSHLHSSQ